jgi:UDP-N-acetyl-D-mannosaminuronic acid transferase (WecB/TagA/CpsF family)
LLFFYRSQRPLFSSAVISTQKKQVLGVFLDAMEVGEAVESSLAGGLILAPSGPGLCDLESDPDYRDALLGADVNLPDSGLAIGLMRLLGLGKLPRTSGLGFLDALLDVSELKKEGASFWVMPSHAAMARNLAWLVSRGINVSKDDCHVAPIYPKTGPVSDASLLAKIEARNPQFIFICTGSGTQEKLGFWLKKQIAYRPSICCIGAAIGFLSGEQSRIPAWADRLCLGWLLRCLSEPRKFLPRYLRATKLVWLILRYREKTPALHQR